jgi:hypothetical protein
MLLIHLFTTAGAGLVAGSGVRLITGSRDDSSVEAKNRKEREGKGRGDRLGYVCRLSTSLMNLGGPCHMCSDTRISISWAMSDLAQSTNIQVPWHDNRGPL